MHVQVNAIGEAGAADGLAQAASDVLRDAGQAASSIALAGATGADAGPRSQRVLTLLERADARLSTAKPKVSRAVENAAKQGAAKGKTLFEKFKSAKLVGKLGGVLGKLQLKAPIHLIDSMITYAIGVVAGMQDMAQVRSVGVCMSRGHAPSQAC